MSTYSRTTRLTIAMACVAPLFAFGILTGYADDPVRFPVLVLSGIAQMICYASFVITIQTYPRWALVMACMHAASVGFGLWASPMFLGATLATLWMIWLLVDTCPIWLLIAALLVQAGTILTPLLLTGQTAVLDPTVSVILTIGILSLGVGCASWFRGEAQLLAENRRVVSELREAQDAARELSRQAGQASERERLALDIHDTIAQNLTSIVMQAQAASLKPVGTDISRELGLMLEMAREGLSEARALVAESAASDLGPGQFAESIALLIARFSRETRIVIITRGLETFPPVSRNVEVVLIRAIQESLANTRKHAAATQALLVFSASEYTLDVLISDNGSGYDVESADRKMGFGIQGIRKRIHGLGGTVRFQSQIGEGSQTIISIPRFASDPDEHEALDYTDY